MRKRILIVNTTMNIGGIEVFLMNILRNISDNKVEVELVFLTYSQNKFDFEEEIIKSGARIVRVDSPQDTSKFNHIRNLMKVIRKERPSTIHINTYFDSLYVLIASAFSGGHNTIVHSHTARALTESNIKKLQHKIARPLINLLARQRISCSHEAGIALFGNKSFTIVKNGIKVEDFIFNEQYRKAYRKELGISDNTKVIGHVGRFETVKNHAFMIEIIKKLIIDDPSFRLVLIGSGTLFKKIQQDIEAAGLSKYVSLLGDRHDIQKLYNIFDMFIFPSLYEGLPISLVEAQANGLPCLVSQNVDSSIKLSNQLEFLPLDSLKQWVEDIKKLERSGAKLNDLSYDIKKSIHYIKKLYEVADE